MNNAANNILPFSGGDEKLTDADKPNLDALFANLVVTEPLSFGIACGEGVRDSYVMTVDMRFENGAAEFKGKVMGLHASIVTGECHMHFDGKLLECGADRIREALANATDSNGCADDLHALNRAGKLIAEIIEKNKVKGSL